MGKYEKKSRPHGGKYQRRGEKGKGNKILPGLLAAAAVLMAVILIFDQPEQTAPETTPVQIQTEAPTAAEATQPVAENPETESDTQPMTQTRRKPRRPGLRICLTGSAGRKIHRRTTLSRKERSRVRRQPSLHLWGPSSSG